MQVCFLSKMYPPVHGGSSRYAFEITNALGSQGHHVDVFTQRVAGESMAWTPHENVTVHRICKARRKLVTFETLYYSLKARSGIDFSQYDIIHGTLMPASTIALSPKLSIETPIVLTSHGTSVGETLSHRPEVPTDYLKRYFYHPMNVVFDSIAGRTADRLIGISSNTCKELVDTYRFDESNVSHVGHGVNTDRFYPTEDLHEAADPQRMSLLFVGRLVSRKRIDLALEAVAEVSDADVEFLIAGTGRHEQRLKKRSDTLGVSNQVRFLGYVDESDLRCLYSSADIFLSPSRYEGFGLTILEAMACGTPVISTSVGGAPDIIETGMNGYIVEASGKSFAERIVELKADPEGLERMSEGALRSARTRTWSHVAEQVEALYRPLHD